MKLYGAFVIPFGYRRNYFSYPWMVIVLGAMIIGLPWLFVNNQIQQDYVRTINESSRETMNLAKAFEEHVRGVIGDADKDLLNLKAAYERDGASSEVLAIYQDVITMNPSRNLVAIYNDQGTIVKSFIRDIAGENRSDRDYFQFHKDNDTHSIYIGKPIVSRTTGKTVIPMTRRINKANGTFDGVVYIGLKVDYFLDFFQTIELGSDQLISLNGLDGLSRVRKAGNEIIQDQALSNGSVWRNVIDGKMNGTIITEGIKDGTQRIASYRVMREYPLVVVVGQSSQIALAAYEKRKVGYHISTALFSVIIAIACCLLIRHGHKLRTQKVQLSQINDELRATNNQHRIMEKELKRHRDNLQLLVEKQVVETCQVNAEMAEFFSSISDPFFVIDKEWRLVFVNKAINQFDPRLSDQHIGLRIWDILTEEADSELFPKLREAQASDIPTYVVVKKSNDRVFDGHIYPYTKGLLVYMRDVTKQKQYEAELMRLDRLNLVGEMAAGIGHEIRNPLTTVRGYLQLFIQKEKYAEHRSQFNTMIEELDRANGIITEFLSLAKNKAVELKLGNINTVLDALFPLLQAEAYQSGHSLQLEKTNVPDIWLNGNELRQMILNLVRNGIEAMPSAGTIILTTFVEDDNVVLAISDTGRGIPHTAMEKLGTPFFTTKDNGTGLGLAVCYRVAERHGAKIQIDTSSSGTTFYIRFPCG